MNKRGVFGIPNTILINIITAVFVILALVLIIIKFYPAVTNFFTGDCPNKADWDSLKQQLSSKHLSNLESFEYPFNNKECYLVSFSKNQPAKIYPTNPRITAGNHPILCLCKIENGYCNPNNCVSLNNYNLIVDSKGEQFDTSNFMEYAFLAFHKDNNILKINVIGQGLPEKSFTYTSPDYRLSANQLLLVKSLIITTPEKEINAIIPEAEALPTEKAILLTGNLPKTETLPQLFKLTVKYYNKDTGKTHGGIPLDPAKISKAVMHLQINKQIYQESEDSLSLYYKKENWVQNELKCAEKEAYYDCSITLPEFAELFALAPKGFENIIDEESSSQVSEIGYSNQQGLIWPLKENILLSCFGKRTLPDGTANSHNGIDLLAQSGTDVYAVNDGVVYSVCAAENINTISRPKSERLCHGFGINIIIKHNDGTFTRYDHLSEISNTLSAGEKISKGEIIGKTGNTGYSFAPHLDFKVYSSAQHIGTKTGIDPLLYLPELDKYKIKSSAASCAKSQTLASLTKPIEVIT